MDLQSEFNNAGTRKLKIYFVRQVDNDNRFECLSLELKDCYVTDSNKIK